MKLATEDTEGVTLNEKARVSIPVALIGGSALTLIGATAGIVGAWQSVRGEVREIRMTIEGMSKELSKIGDRVETQPTRREFEEVLTRLRSLEARRE